MSMKELADVVREKTVGRVGDLVRSATETGSDKLSELAGSVNEAIPIITEAGYEVERMQVTLGVPPKVVLTARVVHEITDEEYAALIERAGEKLVTSAVAGTFVKAAALHRSLKVGSLHAHDIEFELAPLPAVRLQFRPASETSA